MKNMFKVVSAVIFIMMGCVSCNIDGNDYDMPQYGSYVTVTVEGSSFYFTGDASEKFYPGDVSRIGKYETENKNGKRAYIFFNYLRDEVNGFDHNVALYEVVDILSKEVEIAKTEEDIEKAGDDALIIDQIKIRGEWLDINFSLLTENGAKHKMTLLDNTLALPDGEIPSGYQYLELRQNAGGASGSDLGSGNVSYKLNGYHPSVTGKKGLYIRVNTISYGVKYYKIDYVSIVPHSQQKTNLDEQNVLIE